MFTIEQSLIYDSIFDDRITLKAIDQPNDVAGFLSPRHFYFCKFMYMKNKISS